MSRMEVCREAGNLLFGKSAVVTGHHFLPSQHNLEFSGVGAAPRLASSCGSICRAGSGGIFFRARSFSAWQRAQRNG